jgi:5-methylcytosine-specific restriction endonuclease McrA
MLGFRPELAAAIQMRPVSSCPVLRFTAGIGESDRIGAGRFASGVIVSYKDKDRMRAYQRDWLSRERRQWFEENGPCRLCGSWDKLELDHIDRTTKTTHRVWSLAPLKRSAELAKCQVLCENCHKAKTLSELTKPLVHGTANGYKSKRCRCDECRQWNADSHRERRQERRAEMRLQPND